MTTTTTTEEPPGRLVYAGNHPLGFTRYDWFRCVTCDTMYPVIGGCPRANGKGLTRCLCAQPQPAPQEVRR